MIRRASPGWPKINKPSYKLGDNGSALFYPVLSLLLALILEVNTRSADEDLNLKSLQETFDKPRKRVDKIFVPTHPHKRWKMFCILISYVNKV